MTRQRVEGRYMHAGLACELTNKVKSGLLLDVVVGKCSSILELLAGKDETLLIGRDALLVLDLGLNHVDGVRGLHLEGDCMQDMVRKAHKDMRCSLTENLLFGTLKAVKP
jgi:hypothetical protein